MSSPETPPLETPALPALRPVGPVGPVQFGVMPATFEDAWRVANVLALSPLAGETFYKQPANVLLVMELGARFGFSPTQAMQSIAVINLRPSVWGDGMLAIVINSPKYRTHDEYYEVKGERRDGLVAEDWKDDTAAAVCIFYRTDRETPTVARFTVAQARKAGLLSKKGPWETYPDRMLKMRARSWAARDAFPDVLRGLTTAEELQDVAPLEAPAAPILPQRRSAAAAAEPTTDAAELAGTPLTPAGEAATVPQDTRPSTGPPAAKTYAHGGLVVTNTAYIRPRAGAAAEASDPYFEIATTDPTSGEVFVFVTRAEAVYKAAAEREGSADRVRVAFAYGAQSGARVLIALTIEPDDPPNATAPPAGDLFTREA